MGAVEEADKKASIHFFPFLDLSGTVNIAECCHGVVFFLAMPEKSLSSSMKKGVNR